MSLPQSQHRSYNEYLNKLVVDTLPENPTNQRRPRRVPIKYKHRKEVDRFFDLPPNTQLPAACIINAMAAKKHAPKVRVTYNQATNEELAKIIKARIADINLHFPALPFDCRISINLEMDWEGPTKDLIEAGAAGRSSPPRNKDRLSYTQSHYQFDLTQVTQTATGVVSSLGPRSLLSCRSHDTNRHPTNSHSARKRHTSSRSRSLHTPS